MKRLGLLFLLVTAAYAQIPNGSVQNYNSATGAKWQQKAMYETRDWGMACDGNTDDSLAFQKLISTIGSSSATIIFTSQNPCVVNTLQTPKGVTLDFSAGGSIKLATNGTVPGNGSFVQMSTGTVNYATYTNSCSTTFSTPITAGNTIIFFSEHQFTGSNDPVPTDSKNSFWHIGVRQTFNFASLLSNWFASNVLGGTNTITLSLAGTVGNECIAMEVAALRASVLSDAGQVGIEFSGHNSTTMSTAGSAGTQPAITFQTGDFLAANGGQSFITGTCTAGAGFTQRANLGGQDHSGAGTLPGTGEQLCVESQNSWGGGSTNVTAVVNPDPFVATSGARGWFMNAVGLVPGPTNFGVLGGIFNPDLHKIFYNATAGQGTIDFSGNLVLQSVYPEWWGASGTATPAINTPALNASVQSAFGIKRINGSGLNVYNKKLVLSALYQINDELQFYHVIGTSSARATVECNGGGGIIQTVANKRIIDGQSVAYFQSKGCWWQGNASSTAPLIDYDFSGAQGADLAPQFIDHYGDTFNGQSVVDTGVLIAKSGGSAQGSNIYCHDCESIGFTGAAWQVGGNNTGRNVGRVYASNALDIGYDGDIQACPLYGLAVYGGGYVGFGSSNRMSSMENGFTNQTGTDMYCEATQGPCVMEHTRSESRKMISGSLLQVRDAKIIDQSLVATPGAASGSAGQIYKGQPVTSDGAYYQETVSGNFGGVATYTSPNHASSGTLTSLTDTSQTIAGAVTQLSLPGTSTYELMTQAVTGATGTRLTNPSSTGTITGSVTTGTIGASHTMTQATTAVTCTSQNAPVGAQSLVCANFSGAPDNSHIWTDGTTTGTYTPTSTPTFTATTMVITAATGAPDNSHDWVGGTSLGHFTPTAVPVNEAAFTVNAFTGMLIGVVGGSSANCMATITSNTATVINFTGGFSTQYPAALCVAPDQTSTFYVEPKWNHGSVTDGTATLTYLDDDVIGTCSGCIGFQGRLEDVVAPGGRINVWDGSNNSTLSHLLVSRPDWLRQGSVSQSAQNRDWDVSVLLSTTQIAGPGSSGTASNWRQASVGGGITFNGPYHRDLGGVPLCWNTGLVGAAGPPPANTSANEICVGGRSDAGANTTVFRNRLEVPGGTVGGIGPATLSGVDLAGTDANIFAGGSTGAGISGAINFWISQVTGSGATANDGKKIWQFNPNGHLMAGLDNTYDIGAPGATRPRAIYAATSITAPAFINTSNTWTAGTIAAIGDVVCPIGTTTVSDCPTSAQNFVGIAPGTSSTIILQTSGFATLNYDVLSSPSAGWFACVSAITVGKVLVQVAACPLGQSQIGIVSTGGVNVTSGVVWLTMQGGGGGGGGGGGTGTVTNIATTSPITGGTITATGTIACPTCAIGPGSSTAGHLATFSGTDGVTLVDGGAVPAGGGTVTHTSGALTLNQAVIANGGADVRAGILAGTSTDGTFTNMPVAMATPALSVVNPLLVQVQTFDIIKAAAVGTNSQQLIFGACYTGSSPAAPAADGARQVACSSSANVVIARFQAGSAAFINNVVQAQSQTIAGTGWKLFSGRAGVSTDGTLGTGAEVFSVNGQGDIAGRSLTLTTLTPSTSPVCANGSGGALTTTGCTGGGGGGTGTVTHTLGNLTANAIMLGNGVADSKVLPAINTNGNGEIDLGLTGSVSGGLKLFGSTSGSAIITAAPAAGTPNAIYLPLATGPVNGVLTTNGANPQQTTFTTSLAGLASVTSTAVNSSGGALNGTIGATTPSTGAFTTTVAQGATVSGPPGIATGTASNTDLAGQLTLSTGTITYTFVGTYVSAPICVATDVTAKNAVQVSATTTVLTINGTSSDVVNYICVGRN